MPIFGHNFLNLDEHHVRELTALERERAIYTDHWIDELNDFRHVRIKLSDAEVEITLPRLTSRVPSQPSAAQARAVANPFSRSIVSRSDARAIVAAHHFHTIWKCNPRSVA
jgi:hypothetical protein